LVIANLPVRFTGATERIVGSPPNWPARPSLASIPAKVGSGGPHRQGAPRVARLAAHEGISPGPAAGSRRTRTVAFPSFLCDFDLPLLPADRGRPAARRLRWSLRSGERPGL